MSALTSLLVRDQIVSVRKIEEAIQHQVISGGDLESVLLELGAVPENVMAAYRAAMYGLLPATRTEVMDVPRDTTRLVPREVAEQHRLLPLSAEDGTLVCAVVEPLPARADEQLGFLLGHDLVCRVVTEVRMAAALAHHYGTEPSAHMRRLAEKLRLRDAGSVPYVAPPESVKAARAARDLARDTIEDARGFLTEPAPPPDVMPHPSTIPPPDSGVGVARVVGVGQTSRVRKESKRPPPPSPQRSVSPELMRRLRGPLSAKAALEVLREATSRDEILEVLFVFARQFFDFTALFVVHEDLAAGREAFGENVSHQQIERIAVPLDVPGTFSDLRQSGQPKVADLSVEELDRIVIRDMGRSDAQPALVLPVGIRRKVVLLIYGDRGGQSFTLSDIPELVGFVPRVGEAFERLILRRKKEGGAKKKGEPARDQPQAPPSRVSSPPTSDPAHPGGYRVSATPPPPALLDPPPDSATGRPLDVLGVPRSAPPPPGVDEDEGEAHQVDGKPKRRRRITRRDGKAASVVERKRVSDAAPSGDAGTGSSSSHLIDEPFKGLDEPEISYERASEADRELVEALEEEERALRESGELPMPENHEAAPRAPRHDPRVEAGGPAHTEEVVRVRKDISVPPPDDEEPHRSHRPERPESELPSIIVDMGDSVESLVDDLIGSGPDDTEPQLQALLTLGEVALPALVQRFPGPLWFDRSQPHRRLPRGRDICAIARALVAFGERSIPYVTSLLMANQADVRFYATLLSSEFPSKALLSPLMGRVFDDDPGVQALVLDVLRPYARGGKDLEEELKLVRVEARVDRKDPERRQAAVRALGQLRDVKSLQILTELLTHPDDALTEEAHRSLVLLARQDFGRSQRRWSHWVEQNQERHRIEWLIDALAHGEESIRTAAGEELKKVTQQYLGYHPTMPKRDREVAQRKYRQWWETDGQKLHT